MNFRVKSLIVAGALLGAAALIPSVSEGRGGNDGGRGRCGQTQQQCRQQNRNCPQDGQRLRDGSCGNANCPQPGGRRGSCLGSADGTQGPGPQGGAAAPPAAN